MSDPAVIAEFESVLTGIGSGTPLLGTLNARPATLPANFLTIERDHSVVNRVTLGTPAGFREIGVLKVCVNVRSGQGDSLTRTISEEVRNLFHNYFVNHLQVLTVGSAIIFEPDDGNYFKAEVPIEYQFDFFKP